jgi:hypothetical protein
MVFRLVTSGTVEEKVVGAADDKRRMADRSITGGFFDGLTGAAERQKYLLEAIKEAAAGTGGAEAEGACEGNLSNAEVRLGTSLGLLLSAFQRCFRNNNSHIGNN